MPSVRPYTFENLPKFSGEELKIRQSIETYITAKPFTEGFQESLLQVVTEFLKDPCQISEPELKSLSLEQLKSSLPPVGHITILGAGPSEHKILVELDPKLVGLSIERILGGTGEGNRGRRKLTELEEGVVSFGVLKVLQHFQNGWEHANQLALTLERFTSGTDELDETLLSSSRYYSIGFRIGVGSQLMFLRIILPQALVINSVFSQPAQTSSTHADRDYMRRLLSTLGEKQLDARVELAQLDLSQEDVASLEPGDIILIENHQLELSPDGVRGAAFIRIGTGDNGGLQCSIINDGTQPRLEINQIIIQEKPAESVAFQPTDDSMTDAEESEEIELDPSEVEDNLEETEGLLRDVEAPIVIELGRLQMNTAQVIRLKAGQILRLPRAATDPVDLVVNDKVFARGELIEVDGELGVRLVQVTGA